MRFTFIWKIDSVGGEVGIDPALGTILLQRSDDRLQDFIDLDSKPWNFFSYWQGWGAGAA